MVGSFALNIIAETHATGAFIVVGYFARGAARSLWMGLV